MKKLLSVVFVIFALMDSSCNSIIHQDCHHQFDPRNYQEAIQYGKKEVSENPRNPEAYYYLGEAYARSGQIDKAIKNFHAVLRYAYSDKDSMHAYTWLANEYEEGYGKGLATFNWNPFNYLDEYREYNKIRSYVEKSLELANKLKDVNTVKVDYIIQGDIYRDIASGNLVYRALGNIYHYYSKALGYYEKALRLGRETTGVTYFDIAEVYMGKNNDRMAIKYLKKTLNIAKEHRHCLFKGIVMLELGNGYMNISDYKDGKFYTEKGLEIVKKYGNKYWEGVGYHNLSLYYSFKNDTKNQTLAQEYKKKAKNMMSNAPIGDRDIPETLQLLSLIK